MTKAAIDTLTHIGNYRDEKVPVTFVDVYKRQGLLGFMWMAGAGINLQLGHLLTAQAGVKIGRAHV